jgi:DNA-binding FadR family transcriptional regulator
MNRSSHDQTAELAHSNLRPSLGGIHRLGFGLVQYLLYDKYKDLCFKVCMPKNATSNLHVYIARSIGERILGGEFVPGEILPNEAAWGKAFGSSRTAVREALKTLTAKGLILSRPKIGSRVQPKPQWNLFDRDVLDWHHAAVDRRDFLNSVQEVRHMIEPGVAELAARKHTPAQLERVEQALSALKKAKNVEQAVAADVEFHEALMAAANNALIVPFSIMIDKALGNLFDFTTQRHARYAEALKLHEAIFKAVANRNAPAARKAMTVLLSDTDRLIALTTGTKLAVGAKTIR